MWIVAVGTQQIALGTIPVTDPAPMDALAPITVNGAVALTAQPIGLVEADQGTVDEPQTVAVLRIVTIEAPAVRRAVLEVDVVVEILELPALAIDLHVGVAFGAREDPFLGERRRGTRKIPPASSEVAVSTSSLSARSKSISGKSAGA